MSKEAMMYEIGYLLKTGLSEEKVFLFIEKLRNFIIEKKGLIISEGKPQKQLLAYTIKKENNAIFNWMRLTIDPDSLKLTEKFLEKEEDILRFLTIKIEKEESVRKSLPKHPRIKPKPEIMNKKTETEEKGTTEQKTAIKEEEIDKKLEELLNEQTI